MVARAVHAEKLISEYPRFWSKVKIGAPDECWPWLAATNGRGYGKFQYDGHQGYAHRFVYEKYVGPIPAYLTVHHICYNSLCVNWTHTVLLSFFENRSDNHNRRKTHCKQGHEFSEKNTIRVFNKRTGRFDRRCKTCAYERSNAWHRRKYHEAKI